MISGTFLKIVNLGSQYFPEDMNGAWLLRDNCEKVYMGGNSFDKVLRGGNDFLQKTQYSREKVSNSFTVGEFFSC